MVSAVAGGSFAYGWYSVTNVPSSNEQREPTSAKLQLDTTLDTTAANNLEPVKSDLSLDRVSTQPPIDQQLSDISGENGQISLILDEIQLSQLVNEAILSQPQAAQLLANAQSLHTTLEDDFLETGTVLNLSELPRDGLSPEFQASLNQLIDTVPMLTNRDIYIGIVARPQVKDGKINLDQDINFRIGQFTLPLADVAKQIGFSTREIEERLNGLLEQHGVTLEAIEILDEQLVITGVKP